MLSDLKGKPLWAKAWAFVTVVAAVYLLLSFFTGDGLGDDVESLALVFMLLSALLWVCVFPESMTGSESFFPKESER